MLGAQSAPLSEWPQCLGPVRKIKLAFWRERRAGRCKAPRRRRCGDIVEAPELRSGRDRRAAAPIPGKKDHEVLPEEKGNDAGSQAQEERGNQDYDRTLSLAFGLRQLRRYSAGGLAV